MSAALVGLFGTAGYYSGRLPSSVTAESGSLLKIAEYPEISCGSFGTSDNFVSSGRVTLSLYGAIPVKNIAVREEAAPTLIAGGNPFGIKLLMDGVMVTKLGDVTDESGKECCPAAAAGIEKGDVIRTVDGVSVVSNSQLSEIIGGAEGRTLKLSVNRGGSEFTAYLEPVFSQKEHVYKGGMWVRDSIAGIGTMTFINKETGEFAGLGHPVCDSDTGEIVPVSSGEAVPVEITSAKKGVTGVPGELKGAFTTADALGTLIVNNKCGIFGVLNQSAFDDLAENGYEYKMGYCQDITTGKAQILTTVSGNRPKYYDIEILKIDYNSAETTKNMVIQITDEELLTHTGGIVQGMSGSPIIQNGKLIGAVTHVFVADPEKGYAIFAENMLAD